MRIFSFGNGRQSRAIIALMAQGKIPKVDVIAHVNMRPYEDYLKPSFDAEIKPIIDSMGIKYVELDGVGMHKRLINGDVITPFWYVGENGKPALQSRRSCTYDYKVKTVERLIPRMAWATMLLGISADEIRRTRESTKLSHGRMRDNEYPLIELGLTAKDCENILSESGLSVLKSACIVCPFSSKKRLLESIAYYGAYEHIKSIESAWHKKPQNSHKYMTQYLDELPTQKEAIKALSAYSGDTDNSGVCGVCEF